MGWFDRAALPAHDYEALAEACGGPVRVLAWGRGSSKVVVGLADRLAWGGADEWTFLGWDLIDQGRWDPTTKTLSWRCEGVPGQVVLDETGRLPDLFRERVGASILLQRPVSVRQKKQALIAARRNPGRPDAPVQWRVLVPEEGLDDDDRARVAEELARVRAEYDIG